MFQSVRGYLRLRLEFDNSATINWTKGGFNSNPAHLGNVYI